MRKLMSLITIVAALLAVNLEKANANSRIASTFKKGQYLQLEQITEVVSGINSIRLRDAPSIFGKTVAHIYIEHYSNPVVLRRSDQIQYLGEEKNGWIKVKVNHKDRVSHINWPIFQPEPEHFGPGPSEGWVLGEFFGFNKGSKYMGFIKPEKYEIIANRVLQRKGPNIYHRPIENNLIGGCDFLFSICGAYTYNKGDLVTIIGKQGNWLHTNENTWIYHELAQQK